MNFLELVNELRVEVGASGGLITTLQGPLPRETERLIRHTRTVWTKIQTMHRSWKFRLRSSSDVMELGEAVQSPTEFAGGNVAEWNLDTFRYGLPGEGYQKSVPMRYIEWDQFRFTFGLDATDHGKPDNFSIRPEDNSIIVAKPPDMFYTLYCDYVRSAQVLKQDTDIPIIPEDFHELIVWAAKERYGAYEDDPGAFDDGRMQAAHWMQLLEVNQLPDADFETLV